MHSIIKTTRGTDIRFQFNWKNEQGQNSNLTGYTVRAFEADADPAFVPVAAFEDINAGLISVRIPWDDNMPERALIFRVQIQRAGDDLDVATNKIMVVYQ